jgi:hypothetical protein
MEKPVLTWNSEDVATWLDCIGLSNYKEHFLGKFFRRRLDGLHHHPQILFLGFHFCIFNLQNFLSSIYSSEGFWQNSTQPQL